MQLRSRSCGFHFQELERALKAAEGSLLMCWEGRLVEGLEVQQQLEETLGAHAL